MPAPRSCVFCAMDPAGVVASNPLAFAVRDIAPVAPLHTLVLPRRHVPAYFDLCAEETQAVAALVEAARRDILRRDPAVAGFNIAVNIGAAAGQTIPHSRAPRAAPARRRRSGHPGRPAQAPDPGKCRMVTPLSL